MAVDTLFPPSSKVPGSLQKSQLINHGLNLITQLLHIGSAYGGLALVAASGG